MVVVSRNELRAAFDRVRAEVARRSWRQQRQWERDGLIITREPPPVVRRAP